MAEPDNEIRIDKFLWVVRLCKTRSIASEACKGGKVKINEHNIKPSKDVKIGDTISVSLGTYTKTVKVKALLSNRVGAPLIANFIEDLTPQEEYGKLDALKDKGFEWRDRGTGRPTKKDRREIKRFKD